MCQTIDIIIYINIQDLPNSHQWLGTVVSAVEGGCQGVFFLPSIERSRHCTPSVQMKKWKLSDC